MMRAWRSAQPTTAAIRRSTRPAVWPQRRIHAQRRFPWGGSQLGPCRTGARPGAARAPRRRLGDVGGGSDLGSDLPPDRAFTLGGPGSFPGFELGRIARQCLLDGKRVATCGNWPTSRRSAGRHSTAACVSRWAAPTIDSISSKTTTERSMALRSTSLAGRWSARSLLGVGATSTDSMEPLARRRTAHRTRNHSRARNLPLMRDRAIAVLRNRRLGSMP